QRSPALGGRRRPDERRTNADRRRGGGLPPPSTPRRERNYAAHGAADRRPSGALGGPHGLSAARAAAYLPGLVRRASLRRVPRGAAARRVTPRPGDRRTIRLRAHQVTSFPRPA